jgi:hypothetical protein
MRRLIVRHNAALGDFCVALPALECLCRDRRVRYSEVWTSPKHAPLVRFADHVRGLHPGDINSLLIDIQRGPLVRFTTPLTDQLRSFDEVVVCTRDTGVSIKWGSDWPEFKYFSNVSYRSYQHICDFELALIAGITDITGSDGIPRIKCDDTPTRVEHSCSANSDLMIAREMQWPIYGFRNFLDRGGPVQPGDFTIIHPGSSSAHKNWVGFQRLARELRKLMPVYLCCGPSEHIDGAVHIDNLYELACWYSRARLYIGPDTGTTHLASAAGTTTLVLWGSNSAHLAPAPRSWEPRGPDVHVARFFGEYAFMESGLPEPVSSYLRGFDKTYYSLMEQQCVSRLSANRPRPKRVPPAAGLPAVRVEFPKPDPAFDLAALRTTRAGRKR